MSNVFTSNNISLNDILDNAPKNEAIINALVKCYSKINSPKYEKILVSISGGSDSDILIDMCTRCDKAGKCDYVWFDTGIEYAATKSHLTYLEEKYHIQIKRRRALKTVPVGVREDGTPFLSKYISEMLMRLQNKGFQFEDEPYEVLSARYPNCESALKWWCNENGEDSSFNIKRRKYLKEFMVGNPPAFKIANTCCKYSKKDLAHQMIKEGSYGLSIYGVRKSEGGIRAAAYKSCFDDNGDGYDNFRPIFWFSDEDKCIYNSHYSVINSDAYTLYGLNRTGCVGCPFAINITAELDAAHVFEPNLYKAVTNIFSNAYSYTDAYHSFSMEMEEREGIKNRGYRQLSIFELGV